MSHPYKHQSAKAFWNRAVSERHPLELINIYEKKFDITEKRIATAGSCFAQHIGRYLKDNNFDYIDLEPAPHIMPEELHKQYNYGVYSARYGNIYTVRQLLLLFKEALGEFAPIETFWPKGEGYVDPFRPTIEPHPHVRLEELKEFRMFHLQKVRELFETCEVFIFTLGLTEAWENIQDGAVYPIVPGTKSGGVFDKTKYCLHNFNYVEIMEDLQTFYGRLLEINPNCKMILTVSPVPLAATAGSEHVLCATMYSKSVLRAVAGDFCNKYDTVDYFPSYELINSPVSKGFYFMADGRSISSAGVREVMSHFFMAHGLNQPKMIKNIDNEKSGITPQSPKSSVDFEAQCDEEILMLEAGTN